MRILDFLLDNWYITFILLWFIFSLFGGGEKQKRSTQQHETASVNRNPELERQQEELRRQAAQKEAKPLPPQPAPPKRTFFDEIEDLKKTIEQQVEIFQEELEPKRVKEPAPPTVTQTVSPSETDRMETIFAEEKPVKEVVPIPRPVHTNTVSSPKISKNKRRQLAIGPQTLRQAVIWAEILGPPRAKKPFHSFDQQRN